MRLHVLALILAILAGPAVAQRSLSQTPSEWVDPTTPPEAQTIQRCTLDTPVGTKNSPCDSTTPQTTTMQLVFSDEFNTPRDLSVKANDKKWFAEELWCAGTQDMEIYVPEQVSIVDGKLLLTMEPSGSELSVPTPAGYTVDNSSVTRPPPLYGIWNKHATGIVAPDEVGFKSGMVSSWNKFCFTGGYIEAAIDFPGTPDTPGFWPAFWMMGNLARACYKWSTDGFWPWTYDQCGGEWWANAGSSVKNQTITSCPDPPGFDRTKWGMKPGKGRGSPEIDMVEYKVEWDPSVSQFFPQSVNTLQVAPPLPNGTSWTTEAGGQILPSISKGDLTTGLTVWTGDYNDTAGQNVDLSTYRPGNVYQDSVSAYVRYPLDNFGLQPYKIGVDWAPGKYLRWYLDDKFVYEVNQEALKERTNSQGQTTKERDIPEEPMYIILNLAISDSFTHDFTINGPQGPNGPTFIDILKQGMPTAMKVDYVRVYQDPNNPSHKLGCSPEDYPTEQYINCNTEKFVIRKEDRVLLGSEQDCLADWSCQLDFNKEYVGGTMKNVTVDNVKQCCTACQELYGCAGYTFIQEYSACQLKDTTYTEAVMENYISGIVKPPVCDLLPEVSLTGAELQSVPANSALKCCALCRDTANCQAFTYTPPETMPSNEPGTCSLKSDVGDQQPAMIAGTISGKRQVTSTLELCHFKPDVKLSGGDLLTDKGDPYVTAADSATHCCNICKGLSISDGCVAYTFVPGAKYNCYLKKDSGWTQTAASVSGTISGRIDQALPDDPISEGAQCTIKQGVRLSGADIVNANGDLVSAPAESADECCEICKNIATCSAYTWLPDPATGKAACYFKTGDKWIVEDDSTAVSGRLGSEPIPDVGGTVYNCIEKGDTKLIGGDLLAQDGNTIRAQANTTQKCCAICSTYDGCTAWSHHAIDGWCYLKQGTSVNWQSVEIGGWVSGMKGAVATSSGSVLTAATTVVGGMMLLLLMIFTT